MTVGERIKFLRVSKGMTQKAVADAMGISYQNISQYERGLRVPKMSMVRRLAKALTVNAWEIAGFDNSIEIDDVPVDTAAEAVSHETRCAKLIEHFNKLNTAGQLRAIDLITDLTEIEKYRESLF